MIELKNKILRWLTSTQKATAGALGAATAVASATFIPQPYNGWAALAVVVLTWVVTYVLPFVEQAVESFPEDVVQPSESPVEPVAEGEVVEPPTEEIPVVHLDTVGIGVVEGQDGRHVLTVDDVLARLAAEQGTPVA